MLRYSVQNFDAKTMVKVAGRNMNISHKAAFEVAGFIRGMQVEKALKALESVVVLELAVPYKRYHRGVPPKAGMGPARYPVKASIEVIKLLKNLKGAAKSKGLDLQKLTIIHATATRGPKRRRYGRKMGAETKNTHFELAAAEVEIKTPEKKTREKKETKK